MKPTIDELRSAFEYSCLSYSDSITEAENVYKMFHNEQWCEDTVNELRNSGRPVETFNIIRMFTRQLMGYYNTVSNTVELRPHNEENLTIANIMNDLIAKIDEDNNTEAINEKLRLDCLLSGLMVCEITVVPERDELGEEKIDEFGRPLYTIEKEIIPSLRVRLDPLSTKEDGSDARYLHSYKWTPLSSAKDQFGDIVDSLDLNRNSIGASVLENPYIPGGHYYDSDNVLIVRTLWKSDDKAYSVYWSGDTILDVEEIQLMDGKFPTIVVKLQELDKPGFYGIFRDVIESQLAINQAIIQIQLLSNSNKVIIQKSEVGDSKEEWDEFKSAVTRVNSILELEDINALKIISMQGDIAQQYIIIDKALDRIQRVLGVNDSFLGMAYASDSGRKVKLQQNATMMALRYLDVKFNLMFKEIGKAELYMIKKYFRATQLIRVADQDSGYHWRQINKPLIDPRTNQPIMHESIDIDTGKFSRDKYGNFILTPLNDHTTDVEFASVDLDLVVSVYNDDDEKSQLMVENIISGPLGQAVNRADMGSFLRMGARLIGNMRFKDSDYLKKEMLYAAQKVSGESGPDGLGPRGGSRSPGLKLPTNTNEGL